MSAFTNIAIWVLASVLAGILAGFFIGRATRHASRQHLNEREKRASLKTLIDVLHSVKALTQDVDAHSSEMLEVKRHVGDLRASGQLEEIRRDLLGHVTSVLASNQRLEGDLDYARCRMEQQAEELDTVRREAQTDALTGAANRKVFDDRLRILLGTFRREGQSFALILADMDRFKWINDTYGHTAGDRVLRQFSAALLRRVRELDLVARYGGDEFAILLPQTSLEVGSQIAQRLLADMTRTNFGVNDQETAVTVSMGLTAVRVGDTPESIITRADNLLYESKRRGRNQVSCETPTSAEHVANVRESQGVH